MPPPPTTRRDVTGSDGLPKKKIIAPPPTVSHQQQHPVSSSAMTSHPVKTLQKVKSKEDNQYDSRRSETGDEQVLLSCDAKQN
jgi:hypothetical protein